MAEKPFDLSSLVENRSGEVLGFWGGWLVGSLFFVGLIWVYVFFVFDI